jgi:deoxyribodipyrimidine photo-lyase
MSYTKSIFLFHRALRLDDNIGLLNAQRESNHVIPVFIFTPEQITSSNKFRALNSIAFMLEALQDLNDSLKKLGSKLYMFYGKQHEILEDIFDNDPDIDAIFMNKDYTPYAIERESKIQKVVDKKGITLESSEDYLLHNIDTIKNKSNSYYSVFTPFYHECIKHDVQKPKALRLKNFIKASYRMNKMKGETTIDKIKSICLSGSREKISSLDPVSFFTATREEAIARVKNLNHHKAYHDNRDTLTLETTRLSPYIKFGLVSIREVYHKIKSLYGIHHDLIKQLYWREFYYCLSYNRSDMLNDGTSFRESYDKISWTKSKESKKLLEKWKTGTTGYPVVDAGMRELNLTGYMHNRERLITSNFLVKHLFIDWREGERYFSSKLIDYDPSVNNGNWQFTSGSGADSQPFFRMMNPWTQGERHDPNCAYIKAWIPELETVPNEDIHNWQNTYKNYKNIKYPAPCKNYDYNKLKKESKKVYSKAFSK